MDRHRGPLVDPSAARRSWDHPRIRGFATLGLPRCARSWVGESLPERPGSQPHSPSWPRSPQMGGCSLGLVPFLLLEREWAAPAYHEVGAELVTLRVRRRGGERRGKGLPGPSPPTARPAGRAGAATLATALRLYEREPESLAAFGLERRARGGHRTAAPHLRHQTSTTSAMRVPTRRNWRWHTWPPSKCRRCYRSS